MNDGCGPLFEAVSRVRWFEAVGQPLPGFTGRRLTSWDDWPGPEERGVELGLDLQELRDSVEAEGPGWDSCVGQAVRVIAPSVPGFDAAEDAWHAPTTAAWHGAWVVGLRMLFERLGRPAPAMIADQLKWFEEGRWPCGYASDARPADRHGYLVL